jgi:ABC-type sugar transport system ATPase subunit
MGPPDTAASRYGIRRVTYAYSPRISVLKDVSFELEAGVVRGLLGENGSGKSTLIKLLTGVIRPQTGRLHLDGEEIHLSSPAAALERGVGVVHQDYNLFPDMTVAQNVVGVGTSIPRRRWSRTVDRARIESELNDMLRSLGIALDANALVRTLGPAERKLLEIVRALRTRPRFLILDEPTASLEPQASESVLALLDRLRQRGLGLCFVSHRLNEVLQIADDILDVARRTAVRLVVHAPALAGD